MTSRQGANKRKKKSDPKKKKTSRGGETDQQYAEFLRERYVDCRRKKEFCDVTLKVGDTTIESHRIILGCNSDYFACRFKDNFQREDSTITLPPHYVDEQSLLKLLNAMYGAPFVIEADYVIPLFRTSLYLQLTHFIERCKVYIKTNLDKIDTVTLINTQELKLDPKLYTLVKKHVCQNFSTLHSRLMSISFELLDDLFTDPELLITKELLLDFSKKWITHDIEERKKYVQSVASVLKPTHTPSSAALKLVEYLESAVSPSECDVQVAMNALLDYPPVDARSHGCSRHELLSTPLFFIEPCDGSPMVFGRYRDQSWDEMNQFRPLIASNLLSHKEGAVAGDMIYMAGKLKSTCQQPSSSGLIFHGMDVMTQEWIELHSPRKMPSCLVSCDSKVFAYENFPLDEGYHVSVFESVLNRWFRLPAVLYRRKFSGITCSDHLLYMVGGTPMLKVHSQYASVIEFYDTRCGSWARISTPLTPLSSLHIDPKRKYFKRVCFQNDVIYMADPEERQLRGFDVRAHKFLPWDRNISMSVVKFLTAVGRDLWILGGAENDGIEVISSGGEFLENIPPLNAALEPISMPYYSDH